jgi:hypothetical protein
MDGDGAEMHDTQNVLEPHVFGGGENPPGGLQLVDLSESLHPGVIDQFLFGGFRCGEPAA